MRRGIQAGAGPVPPALRPRWHSLVLPFGIVAGLGLLSVLLPPHERPWWVTALAAASLVPVVACALLARRRPDLTWLEPLTAYLMFPFAGLLHDAAGAGAGGPASGMTVLLLLPILWLAITGTPRQLWVAGLLALLTFMIPILLIGPPSYPIGDWRRSVMWAAIAVVIGPVLQRIMRDLERQTRRALVATERVEQLFEEAPHGVALLRPSGEIVRVNAAMAALLGVDPRDTVGHQLSAFEALGDRRVADHLERLLAFPGESLETDCALRDSGGNDVEVSLSSAVVPDREAGDIVMVNVVDISDRRRYLDRLAHLVDHDVLTGLGNRRKFDSELQRHLERCRQQGPTGALVLLDLDNFKQVNDTLGHNAGDQLLVTVSGLLRRAVRSTDLVVRLGGDEFAVLLPDADEAGALHVGEAVVERVREHAATLDGVRRRVTASVGVVTFAAATEHAADVFALADMTMYDAKEAGRDRVALLPEGDARGPRTSDRLQWQSRIEAALDEGRFELHLQPIQDLATGTIGAAEVLLRLREDADLVSPARFVYIAERTGLMPRIDAWVIEHSIELLARLRTLRPGFMLEVNLSGTSIGDDLIESTIVDALAAHDVDPHALILELTETAAVSDVALARAFAERMTALGCRFALDDFGAGFGSFYYLKHLLFDYVKIDGEFVSHVCTSSVDRTIMRSIVGIARDLGKQTVAEFVASEEILQVVREEGVDLAQGFHIGRPAPIGEFIEQFIVPARSGTRRGA